MKAENCKPGDIVICINSGKLDNRPTEEIEKEELKKETYNLLTEEELSELNKTTEEPKVDNVFKREIDEMPRPSAFKATKIKYDKILKDEEEIINNKMKQMCNYIYKKLSEGKIIKVSEICNNNKYDVIINWTIPCITLYKFIKFS